MRRLWNAAYEMGRVAAEEAAAAILAVNEAKVEPVKEKKSKRIELAKQMGFDEGRHTGFEEGRQSAMTADAFTLSFAAGKIAGIADGTELGRGMEEKRWKDTGHFADGTCRAFDSAPPADSSPPKSPSPDNILAQLPALNWADDAESLPIYATLVAPRQPRDFSGLRTDSTNPFDTLQRRHARHHGFHRQRRQRRFLSTATHTTDAHLPSPTLPTPLASKATTAHGIPPLGVLAWIWMMLYGPLRQCILSG
ncbi:hypothetical protein B0H10DRAFT_2050428 [Mycena sp. CBHHK59/15]|nr:hypothetical protein B0H10DRAFT_2144320 [Mycena sp. CBHHK59/15]KAJ6612908.1 hypothetical protein B0H10DRAFT_2050428 [Mycena sp. CBHHK59/15]